MDNPANSGATIQRGVVFLSPTGRFPMMSFDSRGAFVGTGYPPGTSAGSIRLTRRQPSRSSHVPGSATSRTRSGSAYRPGGGDRPRQPSNPQPRTRPVQNHGRNPPPTLPVVLADVQKNVRQGPAHLGRRPLRHLVVALLQHRAPPPEHPIRAPREARAEALHAVRQTLPAARLHEEVRVVILDRVVHHLEPGPPGRIAQRVAEGAHYSAHEARAAQRRHAVADAQRDQDRAVLRNTLPGSVGNARPVLARAPSARALGAAAGRLEPQGGLFGILATVALHCGCRCGVLLKPKE